MNVVCEPLTAVVGECVDQSLVRAQQSDRGSADNSRATRYSLLLAISWLIGRNGNSKYRTYKFVDFISIFATLIK